MRKAPPSTLPHIPKSGFYAVGAFASWGLLPLYWKLLKAISPPALLCHRIVWSTLFYAGILIAFGSQRRVFDALRSPSEIKRVIVAAAMIAINWLLYIYAITSDHLLEASLGYFLTPIVNMTLGYLALGERLNRMQWTAVGLAVIGVSCIALQEDHGAPWIAVSLALTFGCYALVKKKTRVSPTAFSFLETATLFVPAIIYLSLFDRQPMTSLPPTEVALVLLSGVATGVPLLWFAKAALGLPLSALGFLQFISPTLQFGLAVFFFQEPFGSAHVLGFAAIWAAIVVYLIGHRYPSSVTETGCR